MNGTLVGLLNWTGMVTDPPLGMPLVDTWIIGSPLFEPVAFFSVTVVLRAADAEGVPAPPVAAYWAMTETGGILLYWPAKGEGAYWLIN